MFYNRQRKNNHNYFRYILLLYNNDLLLSDCIAIVCILFQVFPCPVFSVILSVYTYSLCGTYTNGRYTTLIQLFIYILSITLQYHLLFMEAR